MFLSAGSLYGEHGGVPPPVHLDVHLPQLQLGQEAGEESAAPPAP